MMQPDTPQHEFAVPQSRGLPTDWGIHATAMATSRVSGVGPQPHVRASSTLERWALRRFLAACGNPAIRVVLWDGAVLASAKPAVGDVQIHSPATLRSLLLDTDIAFGDAYSDGALEIHGPLVDILAEIWRALDNAPMEGLFGRVLGFVRRRRSHTVAASRQSIHHHYDIGNDFYRLWLDECMQYSCAYFVEPGLTLEKAQLAKLDHVCRKLQLKPGQTVIEAGCGWGGLALRMAERYGVSVRAFNLSREQVEYARAWASRIGLSQRVEFIEDDYRNATGKFDAFASVGMLEHVGLENYGELGRIIDRCLTPGGRGLLHSIGRNTPQLFDSWTSARIFPGAYAPSLREMLRVLEPHGFSVLDVENLRLHYARTLEHWLESFELAAGTVAEMFDLQFVRMWRLYLAASVATFRIGGMQLFQVVFARESNNDIPWTRDYLYGGIPVDKQTNFEERS